MKRVLTLAVIAILASAMAFAQEAASQPAASGSDQQAAPATTKKAKKAKKHAKKAKKSSASSSTSESTPK